MLNLFQDNKEMRAKENSRALVRSAGVFFFTVSIHEAKTKSSLLNQTPIL